MKKFYNSLLAVMLAAAALMCTLSISVFASEADQQLDKSSSQTETSVPETEIVTSAADLSGKKIGVQLGTTGAILADDIKDANVQKFNKGADAVLALRQKKIDCVIIDEQTAKAFVDANKGVLTILPDSFADEAYAAVISKDKPELLAQVNSAIEEIRDSGVLQKIIASYIPEKESDKGNYHYTQVVTHGEKLVMATNAQFPPYEYYESGDITGIDIEIGRAIADKLGRVLTVEDMEFDSIIGAVKSGKADIGIAGFTVTEDRAKQISFTIDYASSKQVIIARLKASAQESSASVSSDDYETPTFIDRLYTNFVKDDRWRYLTTGLCNTLIITLFAMLIGIVIGFILAIIRVAYDKNGSVPILNIIAKLYITVIRGTPAMVQLLIIYYVIFASVDINKILVAIIAFGLNSAAYVAEVVRSGIMSIGNGQFEAGKSLGLKFSATMINIILPQAFKNILPALGNEFISLLKETSISGYIGLMDLTRGGDIIRSVTYEAFLPLIAVALIYLILVILLSAGVSCLERRLKKNER